MTKTKVTKRDYFNTLLSIGEVQSNEALVTFIKHEIELLDKKNSVRKPSKTQVENEEIKNTIVNMLANSSTGMTISEITKAYNTNNETEYSSQKISALCHQLKAENRIVRVVDKKKVMFKIAG